MNTKLILIGGAAFVGALYFFSRSCARANTAQPTRGASPYVGSPSLTAMNNAWVKSIFADPLNGVVVDQRPRDVAAPGDLYYANMSLF